MTANATRKKLLGFALLFAGIAAGVFAQTALLEWVKSSDDISPLKGTLFYLLAGVLLILGLHLLGDSLPFFKVKVNGLPPKNYRPEVWMISLGLAAMTAIHAAYTPTNDREGYLFVILWILSILLLVFTVLKGEGWQPPSVTAIRTALKTHRLELFVVAVTVLAAFLLRIIEIEWHPYSFNNDEGHMGSAGLCILEGKCTNFFSLGWAYQPQPAFIPYAISIALFGKTALAVRLISVITGTLAVLAVYLFAREVFNKKLAWVSAVLLSSLPIHAHFSRMGVDNIVDSLTTTLVLWLLFRGVKHGSMLSFLAAGIFAGLSVYTYPGSLLAPAFGMGALALLALRTRRFLRVYARHITTFVLAIIVVVTPIMGYYATHSEFFLARMKKEGILQNGALQKEMQTTGKSAADILLKQFSKASFVFVATDAPYSFFNSPKPYLPPVGAVIFVFGLLYTCWRVKDPRCTVLLAWFWGVVILGSALTASPPTSQRILMSLPPLVIMMALSMVKILEALTKLGRSITKIAPAVLLCLMVLISYPNITFYFHEYRIQQYYADPKDELTYETRTYTGPLSTQGRMFLIANPNVPYLTFKSFDYFAPGMLKTRLNDVKFQTLLDLPYDKDALFIALPGYEEDLKFIAMMIPGGEWREVKRRYQPDEMLFYSYKIIKERLAVFTGFAGGYDMLRP